MSLEIQQGYPVLYVDYGTGTVSLEHTEIRVTDGKSHRIDVYWTKTVSNTRNLLYSRMFLQTYIFVDLNINNKILQTIEMTVDNCGSSACFKIKAPVGTNEFLNVNGLLQIGGAMTNLSELSTNFGWNHEPTDKGFVGCIRNMTINGDVNKNLIILILKKTFWEFYWWLHFSFFLDFWFRNASVVEKCWSGLPIWNSESCLVWNWHKFFGGDSCLHRNFSYTAASSCRAQKKTRRSLQSHSRCQRKHHQLRWWGGWRVWHRIRLECFQIINRRATVGFEIGIGRHSNQRYDKIYEYTYSIFNCVFSCINISNNFWIIYYYLNNLKQTIFNRLFFSKITYLQTFFSIFFFFRKLTEFQSNLFSNNKKIAKIIFKIFFEFFFEKFFLRTFFSTNFFFRKTFLRIFFSTNFFLVKIFLIVFFGENFSFHKNISAKIFFTIFSWISFVFDVCEIIYFAKLFIRNFAYCEFFCFAILVYGKKNCTFFLRFFFQRWTWIPNLKMFLWLYEYFE